MDHSEHDPHITTPIWHPGMPEPQVPNHRAAFLHRGLARSLSFPLPPLEELILDTTARTLAVLALLCFDTEVVRAEPDLRGAVLGRHSHEGDVDYQREWV